MTRPRLVSPVDSAAEAPALLEAGADELYGGVLPSEWQERFGLLGSINQRTFAQAQLGSFEELADVVATARRHGRPFSLTLNAPFYSDEQYPLLMELVDTAVEAGVSGVILADPGLLQRLAQRHPGLELHVSTLAHAGNVAALEMFRDLGAQRAVIPRHLGTHAVSELVGALPGMRLDAFLLVGKCPNTEGLCTFHHSRTDRVWPCEIPYRVEAHGDTGSPVLERAMTRQASWSHSDRRHGCGLCAIPELCRAGVYGLKLVGRGAPTVMKVANLKLVRHFLELAETGLPPEQYRRAARQAHLQRFGSPCSPNVCYYPEFFQGD